MSAIRETVERVLARVNDIGRDGPGWTRPSYSDLESRAHDVIRDEAAALGLEISTDAAGNLFARMAGADRSAPALHVGSHLDTVGQGGAYDGQAGVVPASASTAAASWSAPGSASGSSAGSAAFAIWSRCACSPLPTR